MALVVGLSGFDRDDAVGVGHYDSGVVELSRVPVRLKARATYTRPGDAIGNVSLTASLTANETLAAGARVFLEVEKGGRVVDSDFGRNAWAAHVQASIQCRRDPCTKVREVVMWTNSKTPVEASWDIRAGGSNSLTGCQEQPKIKIDLDVETVEEAVGDTGR